MANKVKHTHTQMDRRDVFLVISLLTNTHKQAVRLKKYILVQ